LVSAALLKASLHDTASMLMHTNVDAIRDAGIKNEISVLLSLFSSSDVIKLRPVSGFKLNQKGLNYMVTMHVHN
jgi:hypothetical protein